MEEQYVIGVDYGTDSVRTVIVNARDGSEVSSALCDYPRWSRGRYCDPTANQFRQHPLDYLEGLEKTITEALAKTPARTAEAVRGLSVDTTGSTPVAVDRNGAPLAMTKGFEENPNAMFVLWKDHTAVEEAQQINDRAHCWSGPDYTKFSGGIYSSEWFWAKMLHLLRNDRAVRDAAFSWVEHCDWIPAVLTGTTDPLTMKRSRCAAGHKAMWHASHDGLPSRDFLTELDPLLSGVRDRLFSQTVTCDVAAGRLTAEWANRLGLPGTTVVGTGAFDAHLGAVGAQIAPYVLTKVMGTSTCDMLIAPPGDVGDRTIRGICGQVDGSIVPGMIGLEAGQSAFGDIYAWFRSVLMWPLSALPALSSVDEETRGRLAREVSGKVLDELSRSAAGLPVEETGAVAVDWMNGRRTPDANQLLRGAVAGLTLGSDAPRIFKSLVEATAFGARLIVDRFVSEGVRIDGVIALGGVSRKSSFVMQVVADILDKPIKVARSEQACALGAAMCAATVAGIYPSVEQAQKSMGNGFEQEYRPDPDRVRRYRPLYDKYRALGGFVEENRI